MGASLPVWDGVTLLGSTARVRVRASAHAEGTCERYQWLEAHPNVTVVPTRRAQGRSPFLPSDLLDVVESGLSVPSIDEQRTRTAWIRAQVARLPERHRAYVEHAAEALLDLFLDLGEESGPLTYRGRHGEWQAPSGALLYAWAMYFEGPGGYREVRRVRTGSAHEPDRGNRAWTLHAAQVVAQLPWSIPCARVVVREVGAVDGSSLVHLDVSPMELAEMFESELRPALRQIVTGRDTTPGWDCPRCALVGRCEALIPAGRALGQSRAGPRTRSLSAADLDAYDRCPAHWYYTRELKLRRTHRDETAIYRGVAIHEWLRRAHARATACTPDDLPADPGDQAWLPPQEYGVARPYLIHHATRCPLEGDATTAVAIEQTYHLYDATADLIVVTKPDLVLRRGDTLVLRETKSSETVSAGASRAEISSRYTQVNLGLSLLDSLAAHHGCVNAEFELELLTPAGGQTWSWSTSNQTELTVARSDIAQRVAAWQGDEIWKPAPNALCEFCDVREWCSERDTYANSPSVSADATGNDGANWRPGDPF